MISNKTCWECTIKFPVNFSLIAVTGPSEYYIEFNFTYFTSEFAGIFKMFANYFQWTRFCCELFILTSLNFQEA